jgi:hypothetical protein
MRFPEHDCVPTILNPGDPASGDESLPWDGGLASFRHAGGTASPEELAAKEAEFEALLLDVLGGRRPWSSPELRDAIAWLRLDVPVRHDRRPPRIAEQVVPDEVLSDVAEDLMPDVALMGERVTGDDRPLTVVMAAVLFFVPFTEDSRRPLDWWADEETDRPLVRSARVIDGAPPCLWEDGRPLIPLAELRRPDPATAPRGIYVGRAYRVADGWAWSSCLHLPRRPDPRVVERRMHVELLRYHLHDRRRTWEDALRQSPEVLYRICCEASR